MIGVLCLMIIFIIYFNWIYTPPLPPMCSEPVPEREAHAPSPPPPIADCVPPPSLPPPPFAPPRSPPASIFG